MKLKRLLNPFVPGVFLVLGCPLFAQSESRGSAAAGVEYAPPARTGPATVHRISNPFDLDVYIGIGIGNSRRGRAYPDYRRTREWEREQQRRRRELEREWERRRHELRRHRGRGRGLGPPRSHPVFGRR